MKQYEILPEGGVRLHLPSGMSVVSALKPSMLEKVGYTPYVPPVGPKLAFGDTPQNDGAGGAGNVPARADVSPNYGQGGAPGVGAGGGAEGQSGVETPEPGTKALVAPPGEQSQKPGEGRIKINVPDAGAAESAGAYVGGAPRRTVVIPGGFPRVSAQVQRGAPAGVLPSKSELEFNAERVDKADIGAAAADITSLATQHAAMAGAAQLQSQAEDEIEKRRRDMFDDLSRRRKILSDEMMALETTQPDPKRFYRQMGSLGKVVAFIGALFGGIRAGFQGGENQFLARMDRLHEQEIQEQKDLRGLRERGIKVRMTELDKLTDLMQGDQDAAAKVLRLQYGIAGDHLLREAAKQTGDMKIRAGLEQTLAQRAQQRQFEFANIWQQFGDKTVENFARVAPQVVDLGGGGAPRSKRQIEMADKIRSGTIRVRGKEGLLRGEPESVAVRHARDAANKFEWFINDINDTYALAQRAQQSGNPNMISEVRRRIASAKKKIGAEENVLTGQGGMTTEEIGRIDLSLSGLDALLSKDTIGGEGLAALDQTRQMWEKSFDTFARNSLVEMPGNPEAGLAPWDDEASYYNPKPFQLPGLQTPAEPQVRD